MKDKDIHKIVELYANNDVYVPGNERAHDLLDSSVLGETQYFMEVGLREVSYHRCYMALLNYIYDLLPEKFHRIVPKRNMFYKWLKRLQGKYKVVGTFLDHERVEAIKTELNSLGVLKEEIVDKIAVKLGRTEIIEYDSISFSNKTEKQFREYVRNQLPVIYTDVIAVFYKDDEYDNIIEDIEENFKKFLSKV